MSEKKCSKLQAVTARVVRIFKKDERTLFRAGFIDKYGNWTEKGSRQARELLYETVRKEMVELATAYVKEAEREDGL
jgi:hypothetical protein